MILTDHGHGFAGRVLPVILPVQYYLDGHRLAVCLGHHALPEQALNDTIVAFAADSIDPVTRSGWSVQVQGKSVIPCGLRIDTECGWPAAAQVVEIEPGRISGLRIHLCSFIDALLSARPEAADPMRAASWASGQRVTRPPPSPLPGLRDRKT